MAYHFVENLVKIRLVRYRLVRAPEMYGRAVFRHFDAIRSQMKRSPPKRTGWLRLLKEILDFLSVTRDEDEGHLRDAHGPFICLEWFERNLAFC